MAIAVSHEKNIATYPTYPPSSTYIQRGQEQLRALSLPPARYGDCQGPGPAEKTPRSLFADPLLKLQ